MLHFNVRGVRAVRRKITNYVHNTKGDVKRGVWEAGLMIRRSAQTKTPVVTGNLKASAYSAAWHSYLGPAVEIGFTASYAVHVHESENAGQLGHLNPAPPGKQVYSYVGQPRFLLVAVVEKKDDTLAVIQRHAKI